MQKKPDDLQQTGIHVDLQLQISSYSTDFNGIIYIILLTGLHVEQGWTFTLARSPAASKTTDGRGAVCREIALLAMGLKLTGD